MQEGFIAAEERDNTMCETELDKVARSLACRKDRRKYITATRELDEKEMKVYRLREKRVGQ